MNSDGKITIVPTPIGNLGDITLRALETLRASDLVCAEDTRITAKLLAAYDISKPLMRLDENSLSKRALDVIARAAQGANIAYCSDAGMPGVSDPGLRLVRAAREAGVSVEVLPGASAALVAYVASATVCPRFYFGGFFPRKENERQRTLENLRTLDAALIFYESPNRLVSALTSIARTMPTRRMAVCRELTKLHEEIVCATAEQACNIFAKREAASSIKGEIVLVIDPPDESENKPSAADLEQRASELISQGARTKEAAKCLATEFGISKNTAYDLVMKAANSK
ncbi:16S rRNA (cytidine(1402)-2'-O)-methyltransferase [Adlercreutzia sp. ZJ304]|uniref:16S rRNA (cytidine(1402)-2'-O)-methyltransferase n=1 Tax=Adlercreutzia sp. ZJ304 TaxID=2709791 RepID=UPI0013EB90EC|nr:16S rRNA (cytidine(1402)-2'-O)-methyltransferase [Adlercreutzia sp. ZJ304]